MTTSIHGTILVMSVCWVAFGCAGNMKLKQYEANEKRAVAHLEIFDDLDFNVFTNQKWDRRTIPQVLGCRTPATGC